ncbi:MAG: rhodanese-like domain-containing protein [Flavisolibacter sp.]
MIKFLKSLFQENRSTGLESALKRGAVIIDVRSMAEYDQGHVKGSKNIPLDQMKFKAGLIKSWNKPVITVCRSGSRSLLAKNILSAAGVEAFNGGAWNRLQQIIN